MSKHVSPCSTLRSYLKPWQVLQRIPANPDNLGRLTDDAFARMRLNNVKFVELRSSVLYLAILQDCSVRDGLARLIEAGRDSAAKYAVAWGLVLTVIRGDASVAQLDTLLAAYRDLGYPPEVVGLDLAGNEETQFPDELPRRFKMAKDELGLGITIHAGETGRAENVREAVLSFGADRIGHGTAAVADPYVMDVLFERGVCVEVCPISNRLTGAIGYQDMQPMREFQRRGVPFVICSDNPGLHDRGLNDDFATALEEGVGLQYLRQQYALAIEHSFLKTAMRRASAVPDSQ